MLAAGADFITLREPGVAADLLSPKTFKELIAPRLTRILKAWKSPKVLHICGSTDPLVEMMWKMVKDSGAQAVSFDIKNNLLESRKKLGNDAIILGNFDVFKLPCAEETTVEQAVEGIKKNIDGLVDAVWPGCDLWPDIKPDNFKAMEKTARAYNPGPTPAVGSFKCHFRTTKITSLGKENAIMATKEELLEALKDGVINYKEEQVKEASQTALDDGYRPWR